MASNTPYVPFSVDRFITGQSGLITIRLIGQLFTHEFDGKPADADYIPHSASSSGGIYYWKDNREIPDSLHCVFEYPDMDLTLMYRESRLSRSRGRVFINMLQWNQYKNNR